MKIEGYEEISGEGYDAIPEDARAMFVPMDKSHIHYFKKAQKFPIVFEEDVYRIKVGNWGMEIINKLNGIGFDFAYDVSFPLLVKAVEKAKEVMKKNESN